MKRFIVSLILFVFLFYLPLTVSGSEDGYYEDYYREYRGEMGDPSRKIPREGMISIDEAMKKALEEVPGEVIKAELEHGAYEIKIFSDNGWITKLYVDPADGSIIRPPFYKRMKEKTREGKVFNWNFKVGRKLVRSS